MAITIQGANLDFLTKMRQKYMNGGAHLLDGEGGPAAQTLIAGVHLAGVTTLNVASTAGFATEGSLLLDAGTINEEIVTYTAIASATSFTTSATANAHADGDAVADQTWPNTSIGYSATASLSAPALATDFEITLGSASEAAKFRAGDTITVVDWDNNAVSATATVTASKGEKLLLSAALGTAFPNGSLVGRRFGVGPDGAAHGLDVTAMGWTPVGMGDVAALADLYQRVCTNPAAFTITNAAGLPTTVVLNGGGAAVAIANTLIGDTITFTGNTTAALAGATARISSNSAGGAGGITVGLEQITAIDSTGATVTSAGFPIVIDGVSTSPAVNDTLNIACTFLSSKINAASVPASVDANGASTFDALSGASQEAMGDQGPVMVAACLSLIDQLGGAVRLTLDQEEKLLGSFGADGKRIRLAQDYVDATDSTLTVEFDNALNDISFPLAGTVSVIDARTGVDSVNGSTPVFVGAQNLAYTRARGSNVLNLTGGVGALTADATTGMIVELAPGQSGPIFKPYASSIESKDMAQLIDLTKLAVEAHTIPAP